MIIETTRQIIDAVRPIHTFYTLETMPWMYPDSVESYIALFNAIDRPRFAVHLDPVNLVCSPQRYFNIAALLHTFFEHLGPYIRSCHAKDILLADRLTTHLDEVIPGKGGMDYPLFLKLAHQCSSDLPVMLEHLQGEADYQQAAAFVRQAAADAGVLL
jgi:sugar phosphate isomerase/epimerase